MFKYFIPVVVFLFVSSTGVPAEVKKLEVTEYIVGVTPAPPYVIIEGGQVSGAAVMLWKDVADSLDLNYRIVEYDSLDVMLSDLLAGKVDLVLTPRTVTRDRLNSFVMSVPFITSKVGAVVKGGREYPILQVFGKMFTRLAARVYIFAFLFIFLFAFLIWLAERKKNPAMFHHSIKGVLDGIWWAVVTMATVGYGETVPKTKLGRFIAMVWMFYAIGLLFLITSEIASELTIAKLELRSLEVTELKEMKTVTLGNTGYSDALLVNRVHHSKVNSVAQGVEEVSSGHSDAFIFDKAILQYVLSNKNTEHGLVIIPTDLNEQYLCFTANKAMAGLMDNINPAILQNIESLRWKETLVFYDIPH